MKTDLSNFTKEVSVTFKDAEQSLTYNFLCESEKDFFFHLDYLLLGNGHERSIDGNPILIEKDGKSLGMLSSVNLLIYMNGVGDFSEAAIDKTQA